MKKNYFFKVVTAVTLLIWGVVSTANAQLYINEFMASNDSAFPGPQGDYPDWIEIYNAYEVPVDLSGYYLADDLTDPDAMYQISDTYPDSVTVPAHGYLLFYANKDESSSVLNLNFKLSGSGEEIGLWNHVHQLLDSVVYGEQTTDISFGRYPDGSENWGFMSDYTPGVTNTNPNPPSVELYINEFMASNDAAYPGPQGDYPDWIEIYNPGTEDVMLGGYYMADDLTDSSAMFQIPDTYPDSVTVPAGGYIVFYANKGDGSSVLNLNFKLSGGGEQIGLWDPDKNFLDSLTYGEQITDTSYGRFPNGADDWYFMGDITPGAANVNPNPEPGEVSLYINEFMASNDFAVPGPQGDYPDWIEIYNAGEEDVMLGGYYMADDLADPDALYQIPDTYPDSVTVPAGGFIVFYANKGEASSVLNLNFKLSGSGEQIGLWNPDMSVIDSLSYGPQSADTSFGRYTDGSETWYVMPDYTPGEPNRYTSAIDENTMNVTQVQNFPNPFAYTTNIEFTLAKSDKVVVTVYAVNGKKVALLADEFFSTGQHTITWNGSSLPAGYYFYSIQTSEGAIVKKATIIK